MKKQGVAEKMVIAAPTEPDESQVVRVIEGQRADLVAAKHKIKEFQEIRRDLLLTGTVDEVLELDAKIRREAVKAEIAEAKMQPLADEPERVRAERRRWSDVAMPSDDELTKLMAVVAEAHPWLSFAPKDTSYIARNPEVEFKRAFYAVARMFRLSEPTQKIAWSTHVDRANNLLRGCGHSEVEGDAVMAAVIAHGDIAWRKTDWSAGQPLEVALDQFSGLPYRQAWRGVLKGEPLRPPLPPRGKRAVSYPIPQPRIYLQSA